MNTLAPTSEASSDRDARLADAAPTSSRSDDMPSGAENDEADPPLWFDI